MSGCICHNNCHFNTSCKNLQTQVNELKEGCRNELKQGLVTHKFCSFSKFLEIKTLQKQNAVFGGLSGVLMLMIFIFACYKLWRKT